MNTTHNINQKLSPEVVPFHSNADMLRCAANFFALRGLLYQYPRDRQIQSDEKLWTEYWHKCYSESKDSTPLSRYLQSYDLSPVECEILLAVIMNRLGVCDAGDCREIAHFVSSPRYSSAEVMTLLAKNRGLYRKRILFHHRMSPDNLLGERVLLLHPSMVKDVVGLRESPFGMAMVATNEEELLLHIKKIVTFIKLKSNRFLSSRKNKNILKISSLIYNTDSNIRIAMENHPRWNLSKCLFPLRPRGRFILYALIGKHMRWLDTKDMLFTTKGLEGALASFTGHNSVCFDEHISYVIDNKWVRYARGDCKTGQPTGTKQQCFELHPEAVKRLGLG